MSAKSIFEQEMVISKKELRSLFDSQKRIVSTGFAFLVVLLFFIDTAKPGELTPIVFVLLAGFSFMAVFYYVKDSKTLIIKLLQEKSIKKIIILSKDDNDLFEALFFAENNGFEVYEVLSNLDTDHHRRYQLYLLGLINEKAQDPTPTNRETMELVWNTKTWKNLSLSSDNGGLMLG